MMFNNCGNLGLPLALLAFGDSGLAPAIVLLIVTNLLYFSFGIYIVDQQVHWRSVLPSPAYPGLGRRPRCKSLGCSRSHDDRNAYRYARGCAYPQSCYLPWEFAL